MTLIDFIHDIFTVLVNFIMQFVYMVMLLVSLVIRADFISVLIFSLLCMIAISTYAYRVLAQNHQRLR